MSASHFDNLLFGRREFARREGHQYEGDIRNSAAPEAFFSTYLFDTGVSQPVDVWERHGPSVANEDHA